MSKKTKTEQLEELFKKWQTKQNNEHEESLENTMLKDREIVQQDFFCADGIICEKQFETEEVKVLFIANEPNMESEEYKKNKRDGEIIPSKSSQIEDFIEYRKEQKDDWTGKLRQRICEIIYPAMMTEADIKSFPISGGWDNALKIAFMNLNKRGGKGNVEKHLKHYCAYYKDEIVREIQIIDPDIIIWLGKGSFSSCARKVFENTSSDWKESTFYNVITESEILTKEYSLICTYHPSARPSLENRVNDIRNKYRTYLKSKESD